MRDNCEIQREPDAIFEEVEKSRRYKDGIGTHGLYEQSRMNERFYVGDQWYGVQAGNSRPLVRRNFIKRIGEYKVSVVCAAPVTVNYSADGIPDTKDMDDSKAEATAALYGEDEAQMGMDGMGDTAEAAEIDVVMDALSSYFDTTSERTKFNALCQTVARRAYISGTGFLYTYWDASVRTGLYADLSRTTPINGDIVCEIVPVENVHLSDPNTDDIEKQEWITLTKRVPLAEARREAKANGVDPDLVKPDGADDTFSYFNDRHEMDDKKVTLATKLYKVYDDKAENCVIKAVRVCKSCVIRKEWDTKLHLYPISKFTWESRNGCAYGDSEITYLIPNQIAVNRALTAEVWAAMNTGMPKLMIDRDMIAQNINNDPGEIIEINGGGQGLAQSVSYLQPPAFSSQFELMIGNLVANTLSDAGANDAALGDLRPDNASAIIQMREAALQPMQLYQNRFYQFVEDTARIWADFWISLYGDRKLKVTGSYGTKYLDFRAERYSDLVIKARVDVGASTMWSEAVVVNTLNNLLSAGIITPIQFLERVPNGMVPDRTGLIEDLKKQQTAQEDAANANNQTMAAFAEQYPEEYAQFQQLPPEQQSAMMEQIMGGQMNDEEEMA